MILHFLLFSILTYVAYYQVYIVPIGDRAAFREDAHILLWVAAIQFGDWPMLLFATAAYLVCYTVERLRKRQPYRPLNLLVLINQSFMILFTHSYLQHLLPTGHLLSLVTILTGTVVLTQLMTVLVTSFLYQLPLRTPGWKRELLRFTLMDSTFLIFYVVLSTHLPALEPDPLLASLAHGLLILAIISLFRWRTVGIRQTIRVRKQFTQLEGLNTQLANANQQVMLAFASSLEKRDPYTAGHSERVADYAVMIAAGLGLGPRDLEIIHLGGLLHDIGKIGIPDSVLNKPGKLTPEEYDIMKQHPVIGEELLRRVYQHSTVLTEAEREQMLEIVLYHHERPDGRGYPKGLTDDQIPMFAKLTAVADAYDAMTSNRAYRNALSPHQAAEILRQGSGTQFWSPAVDAFLIALERLHQKEA
ncbi:HD-GYP domain-containing protein [Tumebacillus sp. DT12]|uniref:HD-GYP domain-containing protein n=1 Tax=Tumebacillus lacus TaxID=2995335 RepID=A0ABT3X6S0_9BACL|nr:HD-GYP domain-containing protein [Tumebacillus lacus]MCX7571300.1 HD-GYP domain-containing protein [Tumebacillus lacus]